MGLLIHPGITWTKTSWKLPDLACDILIKFSGETEIMEATLVKKTSGRFVWHLLKEDRPCGIQAGDTWKYNRKD